ncbi:hypothetical protein F5884DRAFT_859716 [Xylogone sp. PMI_703]|nr:hypothetical protein F5884DRAFT_859716 [Xylogone sp. PMI_703]
MADLFSSIAIIGGGITGPALAIELLNVGIKSTVYEGRPRDYQIGGSMVLTPNALRVCARLGVYSKIRQIAFIHDGVDLVNINGDHLGTFVLGGEKDFGYPALRLHRSTVRKVILAEGESRGIEIKYNMRCISISESSNGSKANITFSGGEKVEADLVVGADGIHSLVRDYLSPEKSEPIFSGQMTIGGFVSRELITVNDPDAAKIILGPNGSFARMPAAGGNTDVFFFSTIEVSDRSLVEWRKLDSNKQELVGVLKNKFGAAGWSDIVSQFIRNAPLENYYSWPYRFVPMLERWSSKKERVVILGDSAHAIPPSAGQGAAMSLEDASTLAIIIERTKKGLNWSYLLSKWENHRKKRISKVIERTKLGSHLRKGTKNDIEQDEKERSVRQGSTEVNLFWLYGYDVESFSEVLDT